MTISNYSKMTEEERKADCIKDLRLVLQRGSTVHVSHTNALLPLDAPKETRRLTFVAVITPYIPTPIEAIQLTEITLLVAQAIGRERGDDKRIGDDGTFGRSAVEALAFAMFQDVLALGFRHF